MRPLSPGAFNQWIYERIDDYSYRLEVYYGGAGSGKSYGGMQKVLLKSMNAKRKVLVIRKVGRTLKTSVFELTKTLLIESGLYSSTRINKSDFEMELPNGSVFLFKGLDDSEKIKSIDGITDIVIEEATEISLDDFTQLNLRLRPKLPDPQIYLFFNPVSKTNWVYDYFIINPPADARVIQTSYTDNRFLSADYITVLEELKHRNHAYYRIYALGEFATLDKLIFPICEKRLISEDDVAGLKRFAGLDFGYTNDPTAIVYGFYDKALRRILITGEYFKTGMLNPEIAEKITSLGIAKEIIVADSARPESIDELKKLYGIRRIEGAKKGPDSVLHGIQFIQQHEIIVDERCVKIIEEFENYTWRRDKKTGEYINEPIETFNHGIDALRYGLEQFHENRQIKILPRTTFKGLV